MGTLLLLEVSLLVFMIIQPAMLLDRPSSLHISPLFLMPAIFVLLL
jgi:hypothetical protein